MNSYTLTLSILLAAAILQIWCSAQAIEAFLHHRQDGAVRRICLAAAGATLLLALHDGYALELALRTGLYDLRQAVLVGLTALLMTWLVRAFRRRQA